MTEQEESESDEFWMREIEKIEQADDLVIQAKDAEITRLRAALKKIGNPVMYFAYEHRGAPLWMGSGGDTPAEFARKALSGEVRS